MPSPIIPILAFLAVFGAVMFSLHLAAKRRTRELEAAASDLGLEFTGAQSGLIERVRGAVRLFDQGRRRKVYNHMSGSIEDLQLHVFDYTYTIGSGKNSSTYRQTVVALEVDPGASVLPRFELRPERFFHKIGKVMGYQDIDLAEHPEFSKRYLVRGSDEDAIRAALTAEVVEHISSAKDVCVESALGWLIVYRTRKRVKPAELASFIDEAFAISNRLL